MKFSKYNLIFEDKEKKHILFNTLSGHSFYVSDDIVIAITEGDPTALDFATQKSFTNYGIIIDDHIDETRLFSYFHNKSKFASPSVSATVLLTWACNFSCVYCFEGAGETTNVMTQESADKFIRFMIRLAETRNAKSMYINLFGGEPLVNIKQGFYILENLKKYCDSHGISLFCGIITNGSLITSEIIDKLLYYNCTMVQITLDGTKDVHDARRPYKNGKGSFDDIICAIKLLSKVSNKLRTIIRINIDKTNTTEAVNLLRYLGNNGEGLTMCGIDFGIVRGSTSACSAYSGNCYIDYEIGDVLEYLWNEAEKQGFLMHTNPFQRWMYCGLYSDGQYTVTPDCNVYKCWEHAGMEEHRMGEIGDDGSLVNVSFALYDWMSKNPLEDKDCRECVYLPACGGGCGVVSYNETGTYHAKGCFKVKGVLEKQIQRFALEVANKAKK